MNDTSVNSRWELRYLTVKPAMTRALFGILVFAVVAWLGLASPRLSLMVALAALTALAALGAFALFIGLQISPPSRLFVSARPDGAVSYLGRFGAQLEDGLLITSKSGRVEFSNAAFWRLLGRSQPKTEFVDPISVFGHLNTGSEAIYRLARAASRAEAWEEVIEVPGAIALGAAAARSAATSQWLRIKLEIHDPREPESYTAWRVADITLEHNLRKESLQRLRRDFEQFDALPVGLFVCGNDGEITYLNATLASWLGIDQTMPPDSGVMLAQILSAPAHDTLLRAVGALPQAHAQHRAPINDIAQHVHLDLDFQKQDGERVPCHLLARVMPGQRKLTAGLVTLGAKSDPADDGTPAAEARFTRLFHAAPIAIATLDGSGRIASANPAFSQMFFGLADGFAIYGMDLLQQLTPDSGSLVKSILHDAGLGQLPSHPVDIGLNGRARRTGQLFFSANTAAAGPKDGSVILYALDTTERKDLEAQFAQSQKMQAIGQLAGGIAHDINNVLTVIIGFSDLLLANSAGDPAFHDLNEIKANANRAANLVRQLLAFSRRQTLRPEILSLNDVISDLSVFLKRSLGEKVHLDRDYGRDLWLVKADQTELGRVFINLAVNAADAMASGGTLTIRTKNISRSEAATLSLSGFQAGDYVMCSVTDTGHGMPAEILEKIFEPFFTTKEVGKGTGLGLSTVYGIVKQTGGFIYCDSIVGTGTTFQIYLPRHLAGSNTVDLTIKLERKEKPRDLTGSGTVLLVEDEDSVRRFAARALRRQGYTVLEAGNGHEALAVKSGYDGSIDLVVSDIVMPEMDGPTLLKELRKTNPELKIIFMSGYADDALSSLDSGEDFAFLSKPFQLTDLVTAVKELMPQ